jgi:hypothetical protein
MKIAKRATSRWTTTQPKLAQRIEAERGEAWATSHWAGVVREVNEDGSVDMRWIDNAAWQALVRGEVRRTSMEADSRHTVWPPRDPDGRQAKRVDAPLDQGNEQVGTEEE